MTEQGITTLESRPTIADILLAHGFVDDEALTAALEVSNRTRQPLGQVLVEAGAITRLDLASALAEQWSDPGSSITPLSRPARKPRDGRTAAAPAELLPWSGDTVAVERLHDEIADLARRVARAEPLLIETERRAAASIGPEALEELDSRMSELTQLVEATRARMTGMENTLGETSERVEAVTDGVEQAVVSLRSGTGELAERVAALSSSVEGAPTGDEIGELRSAVGDLASRVEAGRAVGEEHEALKNALAALGARQDADSVHLSRLDELEARIAAEAVTLDTAAAELRGSLDAVVASRPVDVDLAARVDELGVQVESLAALAASGDDGVAIEELRAALDELGHRRGGDEEAGVQLAALVAAVDVLVARSDASGSAVDELMERTHALEARQPFDPELPARVQELTEAVAALRAEDSSTRLQADVEAIRSHLRTDADALLERLNTFESTYAPAILERAAGAETASEQEIERLRMAIDRMSLHLGEQERAIAEIIRSHGTPQRLDELEARIEDVAAAVGDAGAASAAFDGGPPPAASATIDARALIRRLDSAEAALEAERDKLLTKLERIASALDWRMRRLEASDEPAA